MCNSLVEDIDIVNLLRGNDYDRGNIPIQIQEGVELDRFLKLGCQRTFPEPEVPVQ